MEVIIDQAVLGKALSYVSRIVTSRPSYPVLSNLLIDAHKSGSISFSATNLDITLSIQAGAEVQKAGKITAPAKTLNDFVSFLPEGKVKIVTDKDKLTITSESHTATLATIPTDEFPELPETKTNQDPLVTIPGKEFKQTVEKVSFACARDLSRPIFSAVLIEPSANHLNWVGLDGHRLSKVMMDIKYDSKLKNLLIPSDALEEVARVVTEDDDVLLYTVKKGQQVVMKYGTVELAARQVEGIFPDYKVAMPKEEKTELKLDTEEFLNAIKMARLFSSDEAANRVEVVFDGKVLTISSSGSKVGENVTKLKAGGEGENFKAAFNAQFLMDVLSRVHTESVQFSTFVPATDDKLRGGVFREEKNESFMHIVMPLFTT